MTPTARSWPKLAALAVLAALLSLAGASAGRADSTPVGALPKSPVSKTTTKPGQLVAVALPRAKQGSGLVWRVARRYDTRVPRQVSEGEVGASVVLVFKIVGRGDTTLVFALTRGDSSPTAVKAARYKIHAA